MLKENDFYPVNAKTFVRTRHGGLFLLPGRFALGFYGTPCSHLTGFLQGVKPHTRPRLNSCRKKEHKSVSMLEEADSINNRLCNEAGVPVP